LAKRNGKEIAAFIDRDGTVIKEKDYLCKIKDIELFPQTVKALKLLEDAGFKLILVTNQSGIGRGYFSEAKLLKVHAALEKILLKNGVKFDAIYYCPHAPDASCECRKPGLGMVKLAAKKFNLDLKRSYTIGDHKGDFMLGRKMGGTGVFVLTGHGKREYKKMQNDPSYPRPDRVEKDIYSAAKWIVSENESAKL
jgi:histidinol-phosphate phosphatase family protein